VAVLLRTGTRRDTHSERVGSVQRRRQHSLLTRGRRHGNDVSLPGVFAPLSECVSSSLERRDDLLLHTMHVTNDKQEVEVVNNSLDGSDHGIPEVRCRNLASALLVSADVTPIDTHVR